MWHEARKQERKIRGMLVDYRKRAERRRDFYEKIKADPTQFLQVHGRQSKIHLDPAIAAAAEGPATMMPWQGQADNLIDRFDVRAHLDFIPPVKTEDEEELTSEERQINYERYRIIAQNSFLGINEEKFLKQLNLEEQFGYTESESKKKKSSGAAIGFNYEDGTGTSTIPPTAEEENSDDNSDSDLDVDLSINVSKLDSAQAHEMNRHGRNFGMSSNDFYSFLTNDLEEAESFRVAKEEEHEKSLFSGRKSRRERRAHREKRLANRKISPPSYAAKELPTLKLDLDDKSESRSPSPDVPEKITFITSFGGEEEPQMPLKPTYADKVKYGSKLKKLRQPSETRVVFRDIKTNRRSSSKEKVHFRKRTNNMTRNIRRSRSSTRRCRSSSSSNSSSNRRSRSLSRSRRRRSRSYTRRSRSRSRSSRKSPSRSNRRHRSKSRSRSRSKRCYQKRSRSPRRTSSNSRYSTKRKRSLSRSRSRTRRSKSQSRSSSREPARQRSPSASVSPKSHSRSPAKSKSKSKSMSRSRSPLRTSRSRSKSNPKLESPPKPILRYYGRKKSDHSSSELSDTSEKEQSPVLQPPQTSVVKTGNSGSSCKVSSTNLSLQERLKRKRQALLNKQFKADKIAEQIKTEREKQEQQTREDELREMALKLRRKQRERRHAYESDSSDSSSSSDSKVIEASVKNKSPSPPPKEKSHHEQEFRVKDKERHSDRESSYRKRYESPERRRSDRSPSKTRFEKRWKDDRKQADRSEDRRRDVRDYNERENRDRRRDYYRDRHDKGGFNRSLVDY